MRVANLWEFEYTHIDIYMHKSKVHAAVGSDTKHFIECVAKEQYRTRERLCINVKFIVLLAPYKLAMKLKPEPNRILSFARMLFGHSRSSVCVCIRTLYEISYVPFVMVNS